MKKNKINGINVACDADDLFDILNMREKWVSTKFSNESGLFRAECAMPCRAECDQSIYKYRRSILDRISSHSFKWTANVYSFSVSSSHSHSIFSIPSNLFVQKKGDMIAVFLPENRIDWIAWQIKDTRRQFKYSFGSFTLAFSLILQTYRMSTISTPQRKISNQKKRSMSFRPKREIKGKTVKQFFSSLSFSHCLTPTPLSRVHRHKKSERGCRTHTYSCLGKITRATTSRENTKRRSFAHKSKAN